MGGPGSGRKEWLKITPLMRKVIKLRKEGWTYQEIGDEIGYTRQYAHYLKQQFDERKKRTAQK